MKCYHKQWELYMESAENKKPKSWTKGRDRRGQRGRGKDKIFLVGPLWCACFWSSTSHLIFTTMLEIQVWFFQLLNEEIDSACVHTLPIGGGVNIWIQLWLHCLAISYLSYCLQYILYLRRLLLSSLLFSEQ